MKQIMSVYLDQSHLNQELNKYSNKTEIEDVLGNSKMINLLVEKQLESIRTNNESVFFICGDNLYHPPLLKQKENEADFRYSPQKLEDICGSSDVFLFHTHGLFPNDHSNADLTLLKEMLFPVGIKGSLLSGNDGMSAILPFGHNYQFKWSDQYYNEIDNDPQMNVFRNTQYLTCNFDAELKRRECGIKQKYRPNITRNVYDTIIYTTRNSIVPDDYIILTQENPETHTFINFVQKNALNTEEHVCIEYTSKNDRKLSCQNIPQLDKSYIGQVPPTKVGGV